MPQTEDVLIAVDGEEINIGSIAKYVFWEDQLEICPEFSSQKYKKKSYLLDKEQTKEFWDKHNRNFPLRRILGRNGVIL